MEVRVLGSIEVAVGGRLVEIGGPKQRRLLAFLVVHANRVVSTDRLVDALWGEQPPRNAAGSLQVLLSHLRRILEPDRPARTPAQVLVTRPPGYVLVLDESQLDSARLEVLLAQGQRLLAEERPGEAHAILAHAIKLWRGPALAEFADDDFARSEAARLADLQSVAMEERIRADLDLGRHSTAVADLERLVEEHPLRERLWGLLMVGYYRCGRQADALRAFRQARQLLAEELGIDPSPALQRLEADVLAQAPSLDWSPPAGARAPAPALATEPDPDPAETRAAPPTPASASAPTSTLVGRADELGRLEAALDHAAAGAGQLVLVAGEPGVGKTRLTEELAARAEAGGVLVAWGRCYPGESAPPFWPWAQIMREIADAPGSDLSGPALSAVAHLVPELGNSVAPANSAMAGDPAHARFRLCQDLTSYVRGVAASRTVLLVLDDLHWADVPSMELLTIVASHLDGRRLLVVGTYRDTDVDDDHPLADALATLVRKTAVERIRLRGMTPAGAADFIAHATGVEPDPDLVLAVHARTDGNPFYMTELLRLLASEGAEERSSIGQAGHEALRSAVPIGVRDVIAQRVAGLTPAARTLLTVAAVAGREFDQSLLDVTSGLDEDDALAAVELALARGILVESPERVGRYRFSHALIHETIYAGISGLRRARLHARIADALEALPGASNGSHAGELAHHFWNAAPAVGAAKAFHYAIRVADEDMELLAYERAEEQLRRALRLVDALPAEERATAELSALARLGSMLAATRGQADPEVDATFSRARELCRQEGGSRDSVTALWGCFYSSYVRGELETAQGVARDLLVLADTSGLPELLIAGHLAMGIASFHRGGLAAARDHLGSAIEVADVSADPSLAAVFQVDPRVYARCFLSLVLALVDEADDAETRAREAREMAVALRQRFGSATAEMFSAWLGFLQRDPSSVRAHASAAIALADEHGFPLLAALCSAFERWALTLQGPAPETTGRDLGGGTAGQPLFVALEAEVSYLGGDAAGALALLDDALSAGHSADRQHYFDAALHQLRAEILLSAGPERAAEALDSLHRSRTIAAAQGARRLEQRAIQRLEAMSRP